MLFLGIQKNFFTFIRIFCLVMGAILLEFLLEFFFQDCELAFRWIFCLSSIYRYKDLVKMVFFFLRLFFLTNQVLHYTIYIMFTNKVLHLIRAIFHIQLSFFHLQIFIKELLYVLNTLDQRDPGCKILYTVIVCFILL